MNQFKALLTISILALACFNVLQAAKPETDASQEIEQLILAVEQSSASFQRNGKTYTAQEGADHLRLKLKRGRKHADTTEHFITRLASKSSWSGKPYHIKLPDGTLQTMQEWLVTELAKIREAANRS